MATRRERVILDLEDNFSGPMARAAAAAALLNRELNNSNRNVDKSSKSTDRLGSSVSSLGEEARTASKDMDRLSERSVTSLGRSAEQQGKQIDRLSGRLALFAQAAAVLGPALVPIGAAAIPALSGMALQLGLVAAAGGTAMLAFHGLGDSLKALDAAKLNPSAANLAKLRQELDKLGPAGQDFVFFLDDLEGKLHGLRSVAQQGLLPGVQDGITALLTRLPQVREIMFSLATTMGDLAKNAGESLAGPKFTAFFDYIQTTARPVLTELGQTLGNVFKGFADMLVGFDPLSRSFSSGMLAMSESFAKWAAGLSATTGFQDFVSYIQTNGPRALDAIGAIGNALLQVVEAAAPIGAVVLPVVTSLAKAFSAMADSSVGPALIATAAAVSVLSRSMSLLGVNAKGMTGEGLMGTRFAAPFKALPAVLGEARAAVTSLATAEREAGLAHARYIGSLRASSTQLELLGRPGKGAASSADALVTANNKQAAAAKRAAEAEQAKAKAITEGRTAAVRGAAAAAGLVVATSGVADSMGLSHAASLALMGTLAGGWGAAVGGAVGLTMDLAGANNALETSLKATERSFASSTTTFNDRRSQLAQLSKTTADYGQSVRDAFDFSKVGSAQGTMRAFMEPFTHSLKDSREAVHQFSVESLQMGTTTAEVFAQLNKGGKGGLFGATTDQLDAFVTHITPALQKAGISVKDFLQSAGGSNLRLDGLKAIQSYFDDLSSASGRSKAVGEAIAALGDAASSSVPPVDALKSSLDNLFGIQMSQSEAADNAVRALRAMRSALTAVKGGINSNSESALKGRDATRAYVNSQLQLVEANAAVDHNGRRAATTLLATRNAVVAAARAAGASRPAIAAYVRQLGLTPRNLTTIIQTSGTLSATQKVRALAKLYGVTPRQVKTIVSQAGADPSAAKIRRLAALYHLTPKQVRTLISAQDAASAKAKAAKHNVEAVHDKSVSIRATENASAAAARARAALNSVQSRTVTLTVRTQHITTNQAITIPGITKPRGISENGNLYVGARPMAFADGGFGTDGRYYAREPQMLKGGANVLWGEKATGWEAYISGKPAQKDRNLDIWRQAGERLGARFVEYANGGLPGRAHKPGPRQQFDLFGGITMAGVRREFTQFEKAIGGVSKRLNGLEGEALRVAHAYNLQEKQLKRVQAKSRDLSNTTQSAFQSDPFGNGLTGLGDTLQQDKMNALHMASSLKRLKRKGISRGLEAALAASGDSATAMELAKLSRSQINKYDALYAQRNKAADYAGDVASGNVYGRELRRLHHVVARLNHKLDGIEKAAERGTANGTRKGMNDRSRSSARKRRVRR